MLYRFILVNYSVYKSAYDRLGILFDGTRSSSVKLRLHYCGCYPWIACFVKTSKLFLSVTGLC